MSATTGTSNAGLPELVAHKVASPAPKQGWISWFLTTDHKRIGILYMVTTFGFFLLGGVEAMMIRLQLGVANNSLITPEHYNQLFTMHGTTMLFLFVAPMMAGIANYVLPLQIGARDMAFPRLNALSYWLLLAGGIVFYVTLFFTPPEAGWTSYPPLSSAVYSPSGGQDAWIYLIHLTGVSSLLGAINIVATLITMRAPGMSWSRIPLFCWTMLTYSILLIVALPVAAGAVTMLLFDRNYGTAFFDPTAGGSPLLWQHLFWFFGHPEVYIIVLPAFGMISEILPVFARKPIFGYRAIATSTLVIALISMLVWAHHMYTVPAPTVVFSLFTITTLLVAIPTGVKMFNWLATIWKGSIVTASPFYYAAGFLSVFAFGGITGIFLAIFPIDWQLQDSYFVVAHFHYTLMGGAVFGMLAGLHYWYPKMSGRMLNEKTSKVAFWLIFVGFNVTFLIQHSLGLEGMPRRIYEYGVGTGWQTENMISTVGSFILAIGILLVTVNFIRSLTRGALAGPDPWKGNTLEWFTPSPPPVHNFDVIPTVRSVEPMKDIRAEIERASAGV
ncbi:MAG: cytochrome c oxidase subunit I [Actinobacteria bacterium]|uniref:cytochrome-c oxidase n=1 Tax=freshwater metagenome TaxID=449393 RepID=A0A6J7E239_9ZZZZ|nr:cytochrome c oxidase subunit I [Actinomycetota bacterium]